MTPDTNSNREFVSSHLQTWDLGHEFHDPDSEPTLPNFSYRDFQCELKQRVRFQPPPEMGISDVSPGARQRMCF